MINEVECPSCGVKVPVGNIYCQSCGAQMPGEELPPPGAVIAPSETPRQRKVPWWLMLVIIFAAIGLIVLSVLAPLIFDSGGGGTNPINPVATRDSEVKQNLHAIQLALERYRVDQQSYPNYLGGGDAFFNNGTVNFYQPTTHAGSLCWGQTVLHPCDLSSIEGASFDYHDVSWQGVEAQTFGFGDPLLKEGYLAEYPANPFLRTQAAEKLYGLAALQGNNPEYACLGGKQGELMWNLGMFGELPQLVKDKSSNTLPQLEFPGQFYYHPIYQDGASNTGHLVVQQAENPAGTYPALLDPAVGPGRDDAADVSTPLVASYDLLGYGAQQSKGQDLDNSVALGGALHFFRTGYLTATSQRNPYIPDPSFGDYSGTCQPFDLRPYSDSVDDFIIITLSGGALPILTQPASVADVTDQEIANPTAEDAAGDS